MKATGKLLAVAAIAAGGILLAADVEAAGGASTGMSHGAGTGGHGHWSGGGSHGGYYHGGGGRYYGHGRGYGFYWPSFYWGVPVFWGSAYYWGSPYYGYGYGPDYYYPNTVYREVEREPYFPEGRVGPPTTELPRVEGAPSQGPLYMNYCESAKAYFPKITACPEGWKFIAPQR